MLADGEPIPEPSTLDEPPAIVCDEVQSVFL
jgi:hypothetical protein